MFLFRSMTAPPPRPDAPTPAPQAFRDALAEFVQIGLSVARLVGRVAEAETALAEAASQINVAEGVSAMAESLAQAIEADRATAAAAEARPTVVARADSITEAFARVSRAVRLTVMLAERLDRGWARRGMSDNRRAMARRQIARGVADAIAREADGERAERLTEALADRLESLDVENELGDRTAEEIIREICRALGLDPAPILESPSVRAAARPSEGAEAPSLAADGPGGGPGGGPRGGLRWKAGPPQRRPDG
jgi:hypothetical protein